MEAEKIYGRDNSGVQVMVSETVEIVYPVGFLAYLAIGIARVSASLSSYPGESPSMTATSPAVPVFLRLGAGEVRLQQFLSSSLWGMAFAGLEPFLLDPEWSQSGSRETCYVG